jgi:hypothetical protein
MMDDRSNLELPLIIELSSDELEIVSGSSDYASLMNTMSQVLQMLEQTNRTIIGNMR